MLKSNLGNFFYLLKLLLTDQQHIYESAEGAIMRNNPTDESTEGAIVWNTPQPA